jgi:hypothetical protein
MIHKGSSDPVLIKKISLKIWSLRDEIESRIEEKINDGSSLDEEALLQLRHQYTPKPSSTNANNILELKPLGDLNTGEDEMAAAMAAAEASEELPSESENSEMPEEEKKNIAPINSNTESIDQNVISISLDAPNIPAEKIALAKTVLAEISMDRMLFFCNKSFTEGQSIVIQFCIPKSFIVNADILYCRPFNLKSRIISQNNYTYRALIRFNFLKEGERALLRQFLQSVEPKLSKSIKKVSANDDNGDGAGFNDLDDLGL